MDCDPLLALASPDAEGGNKTPETDHPKDSPVPLVMPYHTATPVITQAPTLTP